MADWQTQLRQEREAQLRRMSREEIIAEMERFCAYDWEGDERVAYKAHQHRQGWVEGHPMRRQPTVPELRAISAKVKASPNLVYTCLDLKARDKVAWMFIAGNVLVACRAGCIQTCYPVVGLDIYLAKMEQWIDIGRWLQ